jgi:hypothetical protein
MYLCQSLDAIHVINAKKHSDYNIKESGMSFKIIFVYFDIFFEMRQQLTENSNKLIEKV